MLQHATVTTPNLTEAKFLTGLTELDNSYESLSKLLLAMKKLIHPGGNVVITDIVSLIAGVLFMVLGYLVSDSLLYKFSTGIIAVPMNVIQGLVGALVAVPLFWRLRKLVK